MRTAVDVACLATSTGLRTLSGAAADAMRALHAQARPVAATSAHRYALADFGLTGEQVDERFAAHLRSPA